MQADELTTTGIVNLGLLEVLTNHGISLEEIGRNTGFHHFNGDDPDLQLPFSIQLSLWNLAVQVTGDPAFGLHFHSYLHKRNYIHFIVHLIQFTKTLGECIELLSTTTALFSEAEKFTIYKQKDGWKVTHSFICPDYHRSIPEFHAASSVVYTQIFTSQDISPQRIDFAHSDPGYGEQCAKILQCPVYFGQQHNAMYWSHSQLKEQLTTANPFLLHQLSDFAKQRLEKNKRVQTFPDQVAGMVIEKLPTGNVGAESIARALGIDRTTLYRRLNKEAKTGFRELVTKVRKELAESYLQQGLSLTEIAYLLGFAEPSAFAHAFKRWNKITPKEWRKMNG